MDDKLQDFVLLVAEQDLLTDVDRGRFRTLDDRGF